MEKKKVKTIISIIYLILKYGLLIIIHIFILRLQKKRKHIKLKKIGILLKTACEKSGYLFLKFGQLLTTRKDLLSPIIINELKKLQNNVQPFNWEIVEKILQNNPKIQNAFTIFEKNPIASGSIAQIHKAILKNKKTVIVKILRPHIEEDTKILFTIFIFLGKIFFLDKQIKFKYIKLLKQLKYTFILELNFENEIRNMEKIRKNFQYENIIKIPKIYYNLSNKNFITMEYVTGIPIDNISELIKNGLNRKKIAIKFVEFFFKQVFRDNFFHADLHPGNIWIKKTKKENFKFILLDFGIINIMTTQDQMYMGENILAFINKDYIKVANLHFRSGWVPKTSITNLEKDIKKIFDKILYKPLCLVSFKKTMQNLVLLAKKYKMNYQPQLLFFQKTLINVEGLTRELCPNFEIIPIIKPIIQHWLVKTKIKNF